MKLVLVFGVLLSLSSVGRAQSPHNLAPFPSWAVGHGSLAYATLEARASGQWASVAPEFRLAPLWSGGDASFADYRFSAQTDDGVIAVWSLGATISIPLGGIVSAFTDILFLDVVETGSLLSGHTHALIWSGKKSSGKWGIQMLGISGASLNQNDVLTTAAESATGEIWLTCGIAGSRVYVLESASGSLLRLQSAAGFMDQRDLTFAVSLDSLERRPVARLAMDSQGPVRVCYAPVFEVDSVPDPEWVNVVMESSPGQFDLMLVHRPHPAPVGSFFVRDVVAGATLVAIAGPSQGKVVVEIGPTSTGPWTAISSLAAFADHETLLVELSLPLVASQFVRLVPVDPAPPGETRQIAPAALSILSVPQADDDGAVPRGATFAVRGANFPAAGLTVTFEYADPVSGAAQVVPLTISESDQSSLKVEAPSISVDGTIAISTASGSSRYPLKIK